MSNRFDFAEAKVLPRRSPTDLLDTLLNHRLFDDSGINAQHHLLLIQTENHLRQTSRLNWLLRHCHPVR